LHGNFGIVQNLQLKPTTAKARDYLVNRLIIFNFMTEYLIPVHPLCEQSTPSQEQTQVASP